MLSKLDQYIINTFQNDFPLFFSKPNVQGIGLGHKYVKGINTFEPCIHVLVSEKVPTSDLSGNSMIPPQHKSIKTDVIETGVFVGADDFPETTSGFNPCQVNSSRPYISRVRPIQPGYCMSVDRSTSPNTLTGTFGYIVTDNTQVCKTYCLLSVNKTFADFNSAPIGKPIIQPSVNYGGSAPADVVAKLLRYVPLIFIPEGSNCVEQFNTVDCAIASYVNVGQPQLINPFIPEIGLVRNPIYPSRNLPVQWTGCASGHTTGVINTLAAMAKIRYQNNRFAWFKDIFISSTSAVVLPNFQDYGALVCDKIGHAIGLFFGYSSAGNIAICDITNVTRELNVTLLTL